MRQPARALGALALHAYMPTWGRGAARSRAYAPRARRRGAKVLRSQRFARGGRSTCERCIRPLSSARTPRAGRHGRGVQGEELRRRGLREDPRHQAHPAGARPEPGLRGHVHPRGEARGAPVAREHRAGVRPRQRAGREPAGAAVRRLLHGDGVRARARPREPPRALPARSRSSCPSTWASYIASEVAKGLDHAHRRRDEQMRAARHRAPRRVAAERAPVVRGRGQGHRLRHREGARRARVALARRTPARASCRASSGT